MNKITFPLKIGSQGLEVANLHAGLRLLLDRNPFDLPAQERDAFLERLKPEEQERLYRGVTRQIVSVLQERNGLNVTGEVDEATAKALNAALERLGAFDEKATEPRQRIVAGRVVDEQGRPISGLRVDAFHVDDRQAIRLGSDTTDAGGGYTIRYDPLPDGVEVRLAVVVSDGEGERGRTDTMPARVPVHYVDDLHIAPRARPAALPTLSGHVLLDTGAVAVGLELRLYRRDFGADPVLTASTRTSERGAYAFQYDPGSREVTLEVRGARVNPAGNVDEVVLSKPLYHMGPSGRADVNLVAPARLRPEAAEYSRLAADLTPLVGGDMKALGKAQENARRQDLTQLNTQSGWDARLVALAANAHKVAADAAGLAQPANLNPAALYGLFRAGLPQDGVLLAQVEPDVVEAALKGVAAAAIVDMQPPQIAAFKAEFSKFAQAARLDLTAPGSRATYGQMLNIAGIGGDAGKFASVFVNNQGDGAALWRAAADAGVSPPAIARLRLQGKLAFLAGNSAPVTEHLMKTIAPDAGALGGPVDLVKAGYYDAEKWKADLRALANNDEAQLAALIPDAYAGPDTVTRLDAYANDMARKLRVSYPTEVVGQLVVDDVIKLNGAKDATVKLLDEATKLGFKMGATPVEKFMAERMTGPAVLAAADLAAGKQEIKKLVRVYQITPNNETMVVLHAMGLNSAFDVTALREEDFYATFSSKYLELYGRQPTRPERELVWRKAHQVTSTTYNIFAVAARLDADPGIPTISGTAVQRADAKQALSDALKPYPTMASLFGSMDFCECEHCRSVLSPAAYFVDLLQFVESEPEAWAAFTADWAKRNGAPYSAKYKAPYAELIERRPDLENIPLTCENTNVALPYIDVVNEILEYYVVHDGLGGEAARDTGDATSGELLAEPQYVLPRAYEILRREKYPLNLPFDLWLETVREFCNYAETPVPKALETFRTAEDFQPAAPRYGWADTFVESLGLSPAERKLFANPAQHANWWELYDYADAAAAQTPATDAEGQRVDLNSAKALARRLGVTYKELVELVKTQFVNPELPAFDILYKLGASIAELKTFLDGASAPFLAANKDLLAETLDAAQQARRDKLTRQEWDLLTELAGFQARLEQLAAAYGKPLADLLAALQGLRMDRVLLLADPDAGCSFDETILRYADGHAADASTFLRLNLFVRLWRKLGWSMDELDRALVAFIPENAPFEAAHFADRPLDTALIYLAHLKALDETLKAPRPSRTRLLTLWTRIPARGRDSLYGKLFLTRSVLKTDLIFDHPEGAYLDPAWVAARAQGNAALTQIRGHLPAIQAALGLTASEVTAILKDAGMDIADAALNMDNLSVLHRYGLLAKGLGLSVSDLITLKALSGKNPFKPLDKDVLTDLKKDVPYADTLAFVKIAGQVKASGLTVADLDFLLRRRFDEAGPYRQDPPATRTLLATLAEGIRAVRSEHALPADEGALTEEFLQAKLGLLLAPADMQLLLNMARGAVAHGPATQGFFDNTLKKQPVRRAGEAGFLDAADYPALFQPLAPLQEIQPNDTPQQIADKRAANEQTLLANRKEMTRRYKRLAEAFLPVLQDRLIRQLATQTFAAATGADPTLVERLLTDPDILATSVGAAAGRPLIEAFAAAADEGIETGFYVSTDGSGARQDTPARLPAADTALRPKKDSAGQDLPAANSASFSGYLAARANGPHRFYINLDKAGAKAKLSFPHLPTPLFLDETAGGDDAEFGAAADKFVELKPGVPYRFDFSLRDLGGGGGRLTVQGQTTPRGPLSQFALYPATGFEDAERAYTLLGAALRLLAALGLNLRETVYIATHAAGWANLKLSDLPTAATGDTDPEQAAARAAFAAFLRLAEYVALRQELAGGNDDLIDVFEAPDLPKAYQLIGKAARRVAPVVQAGAEALFPAGPAFPNDPPVRRLWDALQVAERFGASVATLQGWLGILADPPPALAGTEDDPRFKIARGIRESVKARFDPETWQQVAQPIFDRLRKRQRDALVALIMRRKKFDRLESLYEYFLIDPGMEPVVLTSRIRLATASVQLFIQRCLLNLEKNVHPSAIINADQWEWMKRYRVWEANRKIFLFPENWLEPEFRHDKSHLFKELEDALLQDDVSEDSVDAAFFTYLNKLQEIANLDIVAMHLETQFDFGGNVLHVFGRTSSDPHKYFYRRYANGHWSAWEPVELDIQGDHLAPVVWRKRLYFFWVTFSETGRAAGGAATGSFNANGNVTIPGLQRTVEAQLHWSEYVNGQWSVKETSGYTTPDDMKIALDVPANFRPQNVFVHVSVTGDPTPEAETLANVAAAGVYINLGQPINKAFHLVSRNAAPRPVGAAAAPAMPFTVDTTTHRPTRYLGAGNLTVNFPALVTIDKDAKTTQRPSVPKGVFGQTGAFTLLGCDNAITLGVTEAAQQAAGGDPALLRQLNQNLADIEALMKPVFFQDAGNTFFIEPFVNERTVEETEEWVTRTPVPEGKKPDWVLDPSWFDHYVVSAHPQLPDPIGPVINPARDAVIDLAKRQDWLTNPGTGLIFENQVIGQKGQVAAQIVDVAQAPEIAAAGGTLVRVAPGSQLPAGHAVVAEDAAFGSAQGLVGPAGGFSLVGSGGFNTELQRNVVAMDRAGRAGMELGALGAGGMR